MRSPRRRGQALVEFALVLPLLIVLLLSFFDVGVHFFTRVSVDKAVQSALAAASRRGPEGFRQAALAEAIASQALGVRIRPEQVVVTVTDAPRPGWCLVDVIVRFSKPSVAGLYVSRYNDIEQVVRHRRLYPRDQVVPR